MDFQKMLEFRNTCNPFAQRLGIVVEALSLGTCRAVMTIGAEDLNPAAVAHGGAVFTLADVVTGAAMSTHGFYASTVSANYNYLRSALPGDILTAEAQEVKDGKTLCLFDVRIKNQDGQLLGCGTFTYYKTDRPIVL